MSIDLFLAGTFSFLLFDSFILVLGGAVPGEAFLVELDHNLKQKERRDYTAIELSVDSGTGLQPNTSTDRKVSANTHLIQTFKDLVRKYKIKDKAKRNWA